MDYSSFLALKPLQMIVSLLDYSWVIIIYVSLAFVMGLLIDGYLLPPFEEEHERESPTWLMAAKILGQLAIQGFIVILISSVVHSSIPSPLNGVYGFSVDSPVGKMTRGAGIISAMLMELSNSLRERLQLLFKRLSPNANRVATSEQQHA